MNIKKGVKSLVLLVGGMYLTNEVIYKVKSKEQDEKNLYYETAYGNVKYNVNSKDINNEPILLLHSMEYGTSSVEWDYIIEELQEEYTVYTLDFLGYGQSDKPNTQYNPYMYVSIINNFIKEVIGQKTKVIASGLSGNYVIQSMRMDIELFSKIILVNPMKSKRQIDDLEVKIIKNIFKIPLVSELLVNLFSCKGIYNNMNKYRYYNEEIEDVKEYLKKVEENLNCNKKENKNIFSKIILNNLHTLIPNNYEDVKSELLIVYGEESDIGEEENLNIQIIEESKKMPHVENSVQFLNGISDFLEL